PGRRRADELWSQPFGCVAPRRRLHRPNPQGRETSRPAGAVGHESRANCQPQYCQGPRPRRTAGAARPRRRGDRMKRREFITLLGVTAAWPLAARAQQSEQMRRIGVLLSGAADNPDVQVWLAAFLQRLRELGWSEGRNLRIEYRLGALGDAERTRKYAAELVALAPDVIFASGTAQVGPLLQATRTVPII